MDTPAQPRVLDVGQCNLDHSQISELLKARFGARVDRAKSIEQVFYMAGFYDYDLVLVNRVFDEDGAEGLDLIRRMKDSDELRDTPVMLVSNYPEAQQAAQQAGALPGFGKAALADPATVELLAESLGEAGP